ncbi:hypothetical protein [Bradyrhizobium lablabi]|uniref:hypothetical protein n=1 Tax=Bradyrhizobium lablabi TaxID=722472 RepID=UPI0012E3D761|nr:hypothetical protein [Bradyrhizobium lablabi]
MSARTDALVSQQETGKIAAFIILRCGRLPPGVSRYFNADRHNNVSAPGRIKPAAKQPACPPAFAAGISAPRPSDLFRTFSQKTPRNIRACALF